MQSMMCTLVLLMGEQNLKQFAKEFFK
jgi:hypothetical protein